MKQWSNEDDEQLQERTDQLSSGKSKYYFEYLRSLPQQKKKTNQTMMEEIFSSLSHPILVRIPPHLCFWFIS